MASSTGGKIVGTAERNDFYWFHSSTFGRNKGCLPFTWAKRTVHGLGKWWAKFRTGKFHPGSRICHLYKSVPSTEKTVTKAWNWYQTWLWANGRQISVWNITSVKTGLPFQVFLCSRKFSAGTTQKIVLHLLSNRIFRKRFLNSKQAWAYFKISTVPRIGITHKCI